MLKAIRPDPLIRQEQLASIGRPKELNIGVHAFW